MPISALNFFWLTEPHDLHRIPTPHRSGWIDFAGRKKSVDGCELLTSRSGDSISFSVLIPDLLR